MPVVTEDMDTSGEVHWIRLSPIVSTDTVETSSVKSNWSSVEGPSDSVGCFDTIVVASIEPDSSAE